MSPIPPLLPHQVVDAEGTVHGSESLLTVTVTVTGGRQVEVSTDATGPHTFNMGDGRVWDSIDNTETHDYAADGTYTVTASNGLAHGQAEVTVPGAQASPESAGKKKK